MNERISGRILGLDIGKHRIGVAVSDPLGFTAQPVTVWIGLDEKAFVTQIQQMIRDLKVERIVIGHPLTLRGEKGTMAKRIERLASRLKERLKIPVILWDERLTSVQAQRILKSMDIEPSRKKEIVDAMASMLILQNYLDFQKGFSAPKREDDD
jgi:putative Holliday junction resolvase